MHPGRTHQQDVACPDPSAHEKPNKQMQEQASSAALYPSSPNIDKQDILDKDNNLSSKGSMLAHVQGLVLTFLQVPPCRSNTPLNKIYRASLS